MNYKKIRVPIEKNDFLIGLEELFKEAGFKRVYCFGKTPTEKQLHCEISPICDYDIADELVFKIMDYMDPYPESEEYSLSEKPICAITSSAIERRWLLGCDYNIMYENGVFYQKQYIPEDLSDAN